MRRVYEYSIPLRRYINRDTLHSHSSAKVSTRQCRFCSKGNGIAMPSPMNCTPFPPLDIKTGPFQTVQFCLQDRLFPRVISESDIAALAYLISTLTLFKIRAGVTQSLLNQSPSLWAIITEFWFPFSKRINANIRPAQRPFDWSYFACRYHCAKQVIRHMIKFSIFQHHPNLH